ncbi:MAG: ABC transporter substrate-binding protein [Pseudonocardiaceae bacterium]|nr:ABC transporter substrate-binding protein [Pseudonocardiaceae bacterium]
MSDNGVYIGRRAVLKSLAAAPILLSASACASRGSETAEGTLNIGQISDSVAFFPLFIAEHEGYFKDEGITLGERPRLGTGAKVAAALKSGSIDIGAGVLTDAFNLAENEDGTRVVSGLVNEYYVDIVVGSSFRGPPADAPLKEKVESLVGKRIGITGPGSGTEALVKYLLDGVGRNPATDATLVNLGSAATSAIGALESNRVDALSFFQPIGQLVETSGSGRIFISPAAGDVPDLRGAVHGVMFSTQQLLDRKPDELEGFNRAIRRALRDVHDDPSRARSLLGKYLTKSSPDALDTIVPILGSEMAKEHTVRRKSYDTAVRFHIDSGLIEKDPGYESLIPESLRA